MNIENIMDIFCRLSGLGAELAAAYRCFCETAADFVSFRLSDKADMCSCGGRAEYAAAALAYYRFTLVALTDGNASEVKIGDITVKSVGMDAVDAAEKLCRDAFDRLQDSLEDNGFVFKGV